MAYWLLKSDPDTYSFDHLLKDKMTRWDGIRNHQARNNLSAMQVGDLCLVYHSGEESAIVGTATVSKAAYREPGADDPRWVCIELKAGKRLKTPIPLCKIKKHSLLKGMGIVKQSRLSVSPVTQAEWKALESMSIA